MVIWSQVLDWNLPSIEFYKRRGISEHHQWINIIILEELWPTFHLCSDNGCRNMIFFMQTTFLWFHLVLWLLVFPRKTNGHMSSLYIYVHICDTTNLSGCYQPSKYLWSHQFAFRCGQSHSWGWQAYLPGHYHTGDICIEMMIMSKRKKMMTMVMLLINNWIESWPWWHWQWNYDGEKLKFSQMNTEAMKRFVGTT